MYKKSLREKGSERHSVEHEGFKQALDIWKKATEKDKLQCARSVLMHIGAMGAKLTELIKDEQVVEAIKADATQKE